MGEPRRRQDHGAGGGVGVIELRYCEIRQDGPRRLTGIAVPYNQTADIGGVFRERFEAGAFGDVAAADIVLNRQHDRGAALARTLGGGLTLADGPDALRFTADLPPTREADDVLVLVKTGVLRGASLEFRTETERMDSGVRVIERASLGGLAIVDRGAYDGAVIEARRRGGGGGGGRGGRGERRTWIRGGVKYGVKAHCKCLDGECDEVFFRPEALEVVNSTIATVGRATESVGSVGGKTLRVRNTPERMEFEIDEAARDTAAGRQLEDLRQTGTPVYARPIIDQEASTFEDIDGVRNYSKAPVRALLLKPILGPDERADNWLALEFEGAPPAKRRARVWL